MSIVETIGPGIYPNLPAEQYHALDALNNSRLSWLAKSPRHCKWRMDHPTEPTDAMILGTAVHAAILEPTRFDADFIAAPVCDRRTNAGKALYAAFEADAAGRTVLTADAHEQAQRMADAVMAHKFAGDVLRKRSHTELSALWTDEETGLLCKVRADAVCDDISALIDIKTTKSIDPKDFKWTIRDFGYDRQIAFYLHGMAEAGLFYDSVVIVAVESAEPYEVAVFELDPADIAQGWDDCRELMNQYQQCRASGLWPSRSEDRATTISLPRRTY